MKNFERRFAIFRDHHKFSGITIYLMPTKYTQRSVSY